MDFCYEDVCETADPVDWHEGDVTIAFRRWIESKAMSDNELHCDTGLKDSLGDIVREVDTLTPVNVKEQEYVTGLDGQYGNQVKIVAELLDAMQELDDDDQICIETIDLKSGDVQDLYPMYIDVISGVELTTGKTVNEVKFCQIPNTKPDTRDKQPLVDAVIEDLKKGMSEGDDTVLDELLKFIPWEILKHSLPEKQWYKIDNPLSISIWSEIRNDYKSGNIVHIDAFLTDDDNEGGKVIAKVNVRTKEVEYIDDRAKTDTYAQEMITEYL